MDGINAQVLNVKMVFVAFLLNYSLLATFIIINYIIINTTKNTVIYRILIFYRNYSIFLNEFHNNKIFYSWSLLSIYIMIIQTSSSATSHLSH